MTLSTLMLEIALTRIFSVTMWYHFAFVAISVALFGMTVGALIVHLAPDRFPPDQVHRRMGQFSLLFGVAVVASLAVQLNIPVTPRFSLPGIASVAATCLVISVPFVLSGIVVCLALTRFPGRVNRLYAVDLIGAGLGCVLLVVAFSFVDGPSLVVLIGAIATGAAIAFARADHHPRHLRRAATVTLLLVGLFVYNAYQFTHGTPLLRITWVKETREPDHLYERWNPFSRITVDGDPDDPDNPMLDLVIDGTAGTRMMRYSGEPDDVVFDYLVRGSIVNLPHYVREDADVAVVGMGGGSEVVAALQFDQRSVTGIEMNGDIVDIVTNRYGDFTGNLDEDPRVTIVNDEARSYLARSDRRFDIIQISLIDTWAATAAGAFALTENSLYTTQAWDLFLDRLDDDGILSVTRFYSTADANGNPVEPLETYRTVALAAEVLTRRGVENPRDHILVYRVPGTAGVGLATVMVSDEPFSQGDRSTLADRASRAYHQPLLTGRSTDQPVLVALTEPGGPGPALDLVDADISPPTDDKPFFFQMADLGTFFSGDIDRNDHITRPVFVLGLLAVSVLVLAGACVGFPVVVTRRRLSKNGHSNGDDGDGRPGNEARRRVRPLYAYFTGIGLGFLLVEVAMLQRLSIFLGHPTYGLTVSLFSVLIFSGIGSMLGERLMRDGRPRTYLRPLVALAVLLVVAGAITPAVLRATDSATTPGRIATAVALLAPLALVMGMPFAAGMRAAATVPGAPTAYLWGINGAASVCASVFGVVIALFFGISTTFWAGAVAYALALASMVVLTRPRSHTMSVLDPGLDPESASSPLVATSG